MAGRLQACVSGDFLHTWSLCLAVAFSSPRELDSLSTSSTYSTSSPSFSCNFLLGCLAFESTLSSAITSYNFRPFPNFGRISSFRIRKEHCCPWQVTSCQVIDRSSQGTVSIFTILPRLAAPSPHRLPVAATLKWPLLVQRVGAIATAPLAMLLSRVTSVGHMPS